MTADPRGYVFTYDHENRLRKVEKAGTPGAVLATFRYDALGRRVEMIDESVTPAVVTRYVYDGDNVVAAYEDVGGTWVRQRYYVHGATYIDERAVVHDDGADRDYYTVLDDLYTVVGLADEVGNVFESYDVDAYGTPTMTAHTFSDFDGDGDVDPADFLTISNCYNGSLNPPKPGCANPMADLDRDGDVDGADFLTFTNCYNGALNPPKCSPSDFAVGSSPVGNVYFFTGRRLDAFDFSSGGGGAAASSGGGGGPLGQLAATGLLAGTETTGSADISFWLCFYSSLGRPKNPLDFDGDGDVTEADLAWLDKCISDAGGSTESTLDTESTLIESGTTASASASSTAGLVLYHYRARAHDPGLGRFMQRDPIGVGYLAIGGSGIISHPRLQYRDGMNTYEYVRTNPLRWGDPTGLLCSGWAPTARGPFPMVTGASRLPGGAIQCFWATCQTRTRTCTVWYKCWLGITMQTKTKCKKPKKPIITTVPAPAPGPTGPGTVDLVAYCNIVGVPPPGLPGPPPVGDWPK